MIASEPRNLEIVHHLVQMGRQIALGGGPGSQGPGYLHDMIRYLYIYIYMCIYVYVYIHRTVIVISLVVVPYMYLIEGSLEVKLPAICRDGKAEVGRVRTEKSRSEEKRRERVGSKKMRVREKVGKSRFTVFFQ